MPAASASAGPTGPATQLKRLHIGGLTPNITPAHLEARFKIFGQVEGVETLAPDGLGQPRKFAYITLRTSPAELKRCLNTLSGSMYRGAQLRIAEAKPRVEARLHKENNPDPQAEYNIAVQHRKRTRREMGPEVGREAQDMRAVTLDNYKRSKFWNVTPSHHLIRPISLRPTHALPPAISEVSEPPKITSRTRLPPKRQRRRVINPFLWGPMHIGEGILLSGSPFEPLDEGGKEEWTFEVEEGEVDGNEDDAEHVVIGRWRKVGGTEEEVVRVKRQRLAFEDDGGLDGEDGFSDGELFAWRGDARDRESSPLFGARGHVRDEDEDGAVAEPGVSSPLFTSTRQDEVASAGGASESGASWNFAAPSPLIPTHPDPPAEPSADGHAAPASDSETDVGAESSSSFIAADQAPSRSSSPLFPTRTEESDPDAADSPPTITPTHPAPAPAREGREAHTTLLPRPVPSALAEQARLERSRALGLVSEFVHEASPSPSPPPEADAAIGAGASQKLKQSEWWGYEESDGSDDEAFYAELREKQARMKAEAVAAAAAKAEGEGEGQGKDSAPLRLRGGGVAEEDEDEDGSSSGSESSSSSSSSSGSSESSDSDSDSDSSDSDSDSDSDSSSTSSASSPAPAAAAAAVPPKSYGSLFAQPSSSGPNGNSSLGFSLAALAGDVEMADELDIPLALASSTFGQKEERLELLAPSTRQLLKPSPAIPLFFMPLVHTSAADARPGWATHPSQRVDASGAGVSDGKDGEDQGGEDDGYAPGPTYGAAASTGTGTGVGAYDQRTSHARRPDGGWGAREARQRTARASEAVSKGFWRPEGQTEDDMRKRWDEVRRGLTGEWKKRGREARKQRKRRGGGEED